MAAVQDDFDFYHVGTGDRDFGGYVSDPDPTTVAPNLMVRGTKNVYKKNKGNIAVRDGLKRYLAEDSSLNAIKSSYEWQTSFGEDRVIRVLAEGEFQVLYNDEWVTIGEFDKTRFVFSPWWADAVQQELLVMVNGENAIYSWSGGIVDSVGDINSAGVLITGAAVTTSLSVTTINATDRIVTASNAQSGSDARRGIVLVGNPNNNDEVTYSITSTSPFKSGTVTLRFVTTLPGSPSSTIGYILIGTSKEDTAANLLAFLQDPSTTNATQVGITDTDTIDAIGYETYAAADSLETADGETWASKGFTNGYPAIGSTIVVDGVEYTYDIVASNLLINISGAPPQGELAYQKIYEETELPVDGFAADFIATITNQLIVGSYSSPVIYFSADTDYSDFSNSGDIISGDPDSIVLDELPRGVIVVNEAAYISAGNNAWYICSPNTPVPLAQPLSGGVDRLVIVKVEKKIGASKSAALAQEFISAYGENIVYLDQGNQLRQFGIFANVLGSKIPTVSQLVKAELAEEDFTGGCLRIIEDRAYVIAPISGRTYIYQQRDDVDDTGNIISEKIWQPPFEWNISRIAIINNTEYGYSNQSPEQYQLWDTGQYHDDSPAGPQAYECILRFGYWQFKDRTKIGDIDKVYLEGYMPANTPLTCRLLSDYLGSTAVEEVEVSALDDSAYLFTESGKLVGDALVGSDLVGGALAEPAGLPKFRAIPKFKKHQCFEYQVILYSYALDSQWEIICMGTNGSQVINKPLYLLKG